MAEVTETITAKSEREAFETIASLYPTATNLELIDRRNAQGAFSYRGRTFSFHVEFPDIDEPAPEDLGEDEY